MDTSFLFLTRNKPILITNSFVSRGRVSSPANTCGLWLIVYNHPIIANCITAFVGNCKNPLVAQGGAISNFRGMSRQLKAVNHLPSG